MIVTCNVLEEFLDELEHHGRDLYQNLVRISIHKNPLPDNERQKPNEIVRHEVIFQASMIVNLHEGAQYLVQFGYSCGIDYSDASQDFEGTKVAEIIKRRIKELCNKLEVRIGPGVIGI